MRREAAHRAIQEDPSPPPSDISSAHARHRPQLRRPARTPVEANRPRYAPRVRAAAFPSARHIRIRRPMGRRIRASRYPPSHEIDPLSWRAEWTVALQMERRVPRHPSPRETWRRLSMYRSAGAGPGQRVDATSPTCWRNLRETAPCLPKLTFLSIRCLGLARPLLVHGSPS